MDIDLNAPVISRHSTTIDAPLETAWALHIDVSAWTTWQSDITAAVLDTPFAPGASFSWETYGLSITSSVHEVEPLRRTCWGGPAHGIDGVHVWRFTEVDGGVLVETEESWDGEPVRADVAGMQAGLDASLVAWLSHLKTAAER
ncbi:SRPBCC family protein [Saccharothrix deserti]|uniref:SRPBCC family protein n=1 Tax=Saccharothrix deserti TaxID=2593674 RepID=UPI00131CE317|nr:SRPBCC family protein [Saccharothrix deserti]